jgi:transcriptional regulator with XRE-family HTH domain
MAQSLRQLRTSQLLSIRELAARAGITPKTLTDIEYGRRRPTYETMRTISGALGVSAHEIREFVTAIESRGRRDADDSGKHSPNLLLNQHGGFVI